MRTVQAAGIELAVSDRGAGPTVLFVHGFPLDHRMWEAQEPLAERYRLIVPDLRGFGHSGRGPLAAGQPLAMEPYADDLAALLDALDVTEPIVLCGLSMGGYIALQFCLRHQQRLRGLVVCDARASADGPEGVAARLKMVDGVLAKGPKVAADAMLPRLLWPESVARRPSLATDMRRWIVEQHRETVAAAQRGLAQREELRGRLQEIDVPTLVAVGEHDAIASPEEMQAIATGIRDARFAIIPEAGHMALLENPSAFNSELVSFLETI